MFTILKGTVRKEGNKIELSIVLRCNPNIDFVVHSQYVNIETKDVDFMHGDYFPATLEGLKQAIARFERRSG